MDFFSGALLSDKTDKIPEVYDWFAPLIGDWDCDYYDEPEKGHKRHVVGGTVNSYAQNSQQALRMKPDQPAMDG